MSRSEPPNHRRGNVRGTSPRAALNPGPKPAREPNQAGASNGFAPNPPPSKTSAEPSCPPPNARRSARIIEIAPSPLNGAPPGADPTLDMMRNIDDAFALPPQARGFDFNEAARRVPELVPFFPREISLEAAPTRGLDLGDAGEKFRLSDLARASAGPGDGIFMDTIVIHGERRLTGEVQISGAKNAALALMAVGMMAPGKSVLCNVPALKDVETMAGVLDYLGVDVRPGDGRMTIDATNFCGYEAPYDMVRKMRASVYVMGPMLARLRRAKVSLPGGCAIGARPIDLHLKGFEALGVKIDLDAGYILADGSNMRGAEMSLEGEFGTSVGATINVLMAAVLTPGRTVIHGAAKEPEVSEVVRMLRLMGANIEGVDTPTLEIEGVEELRPITYTTIPDRIEAGTFLIAGAITGGDVLAKGARADHMSALLDKMMAAGVEIEVLPNGVRARATGPIRPIRIQTLPYPGFPTDMQAQFMAMLCMAEGESVLSEGIYPERFMHAAEFQRMGADITVSRGTARVRGVKKLVGAPLMASDLRASAALVLAALAAKGESEILRVYHIDRGYERIEAKLGSLGAAIRRERQRTSNTTPEPVA